MLRCPFFVSYQNAKKQVEFKEFNLLGGCGGRI